nr:hypothetical protein [Tanacetum cinerariifolium]
MSGNGIGTLVNKANLIVVSFETKALKLYMVQTRVLRLMRTATDTSKPYDHVDEDSKSDVDECYDDTLGFMAYGSGGAQNVSVLEMKSRIYRMVMGMMYMI